MSPESAPQDARERIIQAAYRLFGQQGYARTSIQDIADAAAVKKPVLYYYFGSKEALYQALVGQSAEMLCRFLQEAAAQPGSSEERLGHLAETILSLARQNQDPVRFCFAHILSPDADRPACDTRAFEYLVPELIQRLAEEGQRAGELSGGADDLCRLVLGAIQFSLIRHLRQPEAEPLSPGLGRRIVAAALRGFRASS